jgi:peptide/nickel transport system permease protein
LRDRDGSVEEGDAVLRVLVRRLMWSVPLVLVATALSFVLIALVPGDAARAILGPLGTPEQEHALRTQLGLDQPLLSQYGQWISHALRGDLGTSIFTGQPVTTELNQHLEVTLSLLILGTLASAVIGVGLGIAGAVRGGVIGRSVDILSLAGLAIPSFWLALVLTAVFSVALRLFPVVGYVGLAESPLRWAQSLVLPVAALALGSSTVIAKQTRDSLRQVLDQDFIRTLRANGFSGRSILYRHALRNAGIPVLTVIGVVFVSLIGGTVFVEQVFAMPGLGSKAVEATTQHNLPVILGVVAYFTLLVVAVNLLTDLCYAALDPRVRTR